MATCQLMRHRGTAILVCCLSSLLAITYAIAEQAREAYVYKRDKFYSIIPSSDDLPDPHGDRNLLSQIRVDIPRTNPIDGVTYFKHVNWLFGQAHVQQYVSLAASF